MVLSDVKIAQAQTLVHAAYVPTEPTAAHSLASLRGSKSRIIRTTDSSMTDPLSGRAAHDLPRTPPSVTLESNAVAISCVSPSSLKTRGQGLQIPARNDPILTSRCCGAILA